MKKQIFRSSVMFRYRTESSRDDVLLHVRRPRTRRAFAVLLLASALTVLLAWTTRVPTLVYADASIRGGVVRLASVSPQRFRISPGQTVALRCRRGALYRGQIERVAITGELTVSITPASPVTRADDCRATILAGEASLLESLAAAAGWRNRGTVAKAG
jgi:hypothetical protein